MLAGKKVLILEDEPIIGLALEDMVEQLGCTICGIAFRVPEALELARTAPCDVGILDVNIAGELSYPVAEILADRDVPVIFATGYGDRQHPVRFKSFPTLTKPYGAVEMEGALVRVFEQG